MEKNTEYTANKAVFCLDQIAATLLKLSGGFAVDDKELQRTLLYQAYIRTVLSRNCDLVRVNGEG